MAPPPVPPGELGVGSDAIPVRKLVTRGGPLLIVATLLGFGISASSADAERREDAARRTRCAPVPSTVVDAIAAGLGDLDGDEIRGWGATQAGEASEGQLAGTWFVSAEIAPTRLAEGATGDIATWVVPDDAGAPAAVEPHAIDRHAGTYSSWPRADGIEVTHDGGVESRWCAKDASRHD